jgi:hypothetical protein
MQDGHVTRKTAFIADSLLIIVVVVRRFDDADLLTELARNRDFLMRNADGTSSAWYAASARYTPLNDSSPPHMPIIAQHRTATTSTYILNLCSIPIDSCTLAVDRPLPAMVASPNLYPL